jgi:hypothetical protein
LDLSKPVSLRAYNHGFSAMPGELNPFDTATQSEQAAWWHLGYGDAREFDKEQAHVLKMRTNYPQFADLTLRAFFNVD